MPDLGEIFRLTVDPAELVLRGTAIYWFLLLLFRFVLRRDVGTIGIADVLLLMLIADAAQNAMSGGYESVTDGFILVGTIAGWNWLVDFSAYHVPAFGRLLQARALPLVRNGKLLRRNMRREFITVEELMAKFREQGIEKVEQVKAANLENDGEISVIKAGDSPPSPGSGGKKKAVN